MIEQEYNGLDDSIQYMVEFFYTRIENLETPIPPSILLRKRKTNKKNPKERESLTYKGSEGEYSIKDKKRKKLCKCHGMHIYTKCTRFKTLIKQAKQKKSNKFKKEKKNTKQEGHIMVEKKVKNELQNKKRSILRNYVHLRKWVFPIFNKSPLAAAPPKKARFEN